MPLSFLRTLPGKWAPDLFGMAKAGASQNEYQNYVEMQVAVLIDTVRGRAGLGGD